MYARLQENYAAFVDNLDQNVGRLIVHLQAIGEWENTFFIFLSDNGGSAEVSVEGASNALRYFHKRPSTTAQNLEDFDAIGDVTTHPHYPRGWMQASNTPFIHSKRTSHGGGVRVPLIISWPRGIEEHGIRHQFHHITDIMPTLMEILGIALPSKYQGRAIEPMEGTSMVYSFDDPGAEDHKTEQYYEMEGRRAYYDNGWKIISYREPGQEFDEAPWELYNLSEDFSESRDLAAEYPAKIESIEEKWWEASRTYNVLPIIDVPLLERPMYTRHWLERGPGHFEYRPGVNTIQRFKGPILPNHSFTLTATIDRTNESQEGVLAALGDVYSGYTLYIKDNHLRFELNLAYEVKKLVSDIEVPIGPVTVQYRFHKVPTALAVAKGLFSDGLDFDRLAVLEGTGSLWIDDRKVAEAEIDQPLFAVWEGLDIGRDLLTPVCPEYSSPFAFTGELQRVVYDLD
jgi:arylsulfatase